MLRNYLKIALRTFKRQPVYSLINVAGLAVGLAVCLLASLYVQEELSYDEFHEHGDRIVAIGNDVRGPRRLINPYPLAEALENEVPAVEEATRVVGPSGTLRLRPDGKSSSDVGPVLTAESDFFEIFSFELVRGHPGRVLSAPNSLVLTRSKARQLFGEGDAMDRTLSWH